MNVETIAIVIGISSYQQKEMVSLPAAQVDGVHFARALKNWGVPESNISLFLNEQATRENIDAFFLSLSKKIEYKFLFYFCGHGFRSSSSIPQSYLLLHDSSIQDNHCSNALNLDLFVRDFGKLNCSECYVFIDACYLRVNEILNPMLKEETLGNKRKKKSFFCLLSSGIEPSFEYVREQYGYFTEALLRGLSTIGGSGCSPTELLDLINQELKSKDLPLPEMYNIECQRISFIPSPSSVDFIYRKEFIKRIQDTLILNRKKAICLIGETGLGKTTICRWLASEKLKTIYTFISESTVKSFDPVQHLASVIKTHYKESPNISLSSSEFLAWFSMNFPYYWILVDNIEKLSIKQIHLFLKTVSQFSIRVLFTSLHSIQHLIEERSYELIELEIPSLSLSEGKELIERARPGFDEKESSLIHVISQGNPLKIKRILFSEEMTLPNLTPLDIDLKRAIAAMCSCGLYIHEPLFMKVFNLKDAVLNFLKESGLIIHTEGGYKPHELLFEIAESEELPLEEKTTLNYWYQQVNEMPNHVEAAKHLIFSILAFGYEEKADSFLIMAFKLLFQNNREHLRDLIESAMIFFPLPHVTGASLYLAEILVELEQFATSKQLLTQKTIPENLQIRVNYCLIQHCWQTGNLQQAIFMSSEHIKKENNSFNRMKLIFFRGVSHLLCLNRIEASKDFTTVHEMCPQGLYGIRAQCMLGTIEGIFGMDLELVREKLEIASSLLMKEKDLSGVWAAWNNLGELLWRGGEYQLALQYLKKALTIARTLRYNPAIYETMRNLLELSLRSSPFSKETAAHIEALESAEHSYFLKIQVFNTLAFAHLVQRNTQKGLLYLKHVCPLTARNRGLHIQTVFNLALLAKVMGKSAQSYAYVQKAMDEAKKEGEILTLELMQKDLSRFFFSSN